MSSVNAAVIGLSVGLFVTFFATVSFISEFRYVSGDQYERANERCRYGVERVYLDGDYICRGETDTK